MKRTLLLTLLTCCVVLIGKGQQIDLFGQISIQNSEYKTGKRQFVKDAQIRAAYTKSTVSDEQGQFKLTFVGIGAGESVRLSVTHSRYVVVNRPELDEVILGRKPILRIYMSREADLFESQDSLYHIAEQSLVREYNRKISILQQKNDRSQRLVADLKNQLSSTIKDSQTATEALKTQYEEALRKTREFAQELAAVNLDDASERYKRAFELWKRGSIDSAIVVLDDKALEADYQQSVAERKGGQQLMQQGQIKFQKGELRYEQTMQSYRLKQKIFAQKLQRKEERDITLKMLEILEAEKGTDDPDVIELRFDLSSFYGTDEKEKAIDLLKKNLTICKQSENLGNSILCLSSKFRISHRYTEYGDYENAVIWSNQTQQAIDEFKTMDDGRDSLRLIIGDIMILMNSNTRIAIESLKGNAENAQKFSRQLEEALKRIPNIEAKPEILERLKKAGFYNSQEDGKGGAIIYVMLAESMLAKGYGTGEAVYDSVITLYNIGAQKLRLKNDTTSSGQLRIYKGLSRVYRIKGGEDNLRKSIQYNTAAYNLLERIKPDDKQYFNDIYADQAKSYLGLEKADSAFLYVQKISTKDSEVDATYNFLRGDVYKARKEYTLADKYYKKHMNSRFFKSKSAFIKALEYREIAQYYQEVDSLDRAEKLYQTGLSIMDTIQGVLRKGLYTFYNPIGTIRYLKKDYKNAQLFFEKAYKLVQDENPTDPYRKEIENEYAQLLTALGAIESDKKQYDRAFAYFAQAEKLAPNFSYLNFVRAQTYTELKRPSEAAEDYRKGFQKGHGNFGKSLSEEQFAILAKYAIVLKSINQLDSAVVYFTKIIEATEGKPEAKKKFTVALSERAHCYLNLKRYPQAKTDYLTIVPHYPATIDQYQIYFNVGMIHHYQREYDSAYVYFSEAIVTLDAPVKYRSQLINAYMYRANSANRTAKYPVANNDYKLLLKMDTTASNQIDYIARLSNIQIQLNHCDSAQIYNAKLIDLIGTKPVYGSFRAGALSRSGYCRYKSGQYKAALSDYLTALQLDTTRAAQVEIYGSMSQLYFELYQYDSVVICNQRLISLSENVPAYQTTLPGRWSTLGVSLDRLGRYKEALIAHIRYRDLANSQIALALYDNNVGMAYLGLGDLEKAKSHFTKFEAGKNDSSRIARNWSLYYAVAGQSSLATNYLRKAIRLGYNDWWFIQHDRRFDAIRKEPEFEQIMRSAQTKNR